MKLLPPKARPGDRVAILSPSLAAPGFAPAVHEQAMTRLAALTGLVLTIVWLYVEFLRLLSYLRD